MGNRGRSADEYFPDNPVVGQTYTYEIEFCDGDGKVVQSHTEVVVWDGTNWVAKR